VTNKDKRPKARDRGDPVTARRFLAALADALDGMTARELTRFVDYLRQQARGRERRP